MNKGQHVCSSFMGPCKLHAAMSVDVLYTKICSDGFNGSEHPAAWSKQNGCHIRKCRCCFIYRNIPEIENLYPKEEAGVMSGEPVCAPPQQHPQPPSRFNAKVPGNNMWLMPHPPYFPDLAHCDFFFIFPKLKLVLKGQHLGDLEGIKSKTASSFLQSIPKFDFKRCYDDYCVYGRV